MAWAEDVRLFRAGVTRKEYVVHEGLDRKLFRCQRLAEGNMPMSVIASEWVTLVVEEPSSASPALSRHPLSR
jgi:hypothetical protein